MLNTIITPKDLFTFFKTYQKHMKNFHIHLHNDMLDMWQDRKYLSEQAMRSLIQTACEVSKLKRPKRKCKKGLITERNILSRMGTRITADYRRGKR